MSARNRPVAQASRLSVRSGFSLTELMIAIGIAAVVTAITIPVTGTLISGNRAMSCASRMQRIHHALRMYVMDWGNVPPYHPAAGATNPNSDGPPMGPGLRALQTAGYLKSETNLHCPSDRQNPVGSLNYGMSYCLRDTNAEAGSGAYGDYNQYKYLSCRGVSAVGDPNYRRQLTPLDGATGWPIFPRTWSPDDTTVVTWCDLHFMNLREGNKGQYQVLFWDGSVRRIDGDLFRGGGPDGAWKVSPDLDDTPT
jgi:prepilin-type N-terminal cleavage/methylation domain-containing protein